MDKNHPKQPKLSVVIPTLNCGKMIERHITSVLSWADLADEIIVVDSFSTDGTLEYIKERLIHKNLRIIVRERGLYESWNEGIAATNGRWIYISTAGDTIERNHLIRLMDAGELLQADVVVSPYTFVDEHGDAYKGPKIRLPQIYHELRSHGNVVVDKFLTHYFAFQNEKPNALLGSCASDIFRGQFLRDRPFPTNYSTHGDTAWTLRYSNEMRLCLVPTVGSVFCIHPKDDYHGLNNMGQILEEIFKNELVNSQTHLSPAALYSNLDVIRKIKIKVREIQFGRRKRWKGSQGINRNRWKWISMTITYLSLKALLAIYSLILKIKTKLYIYFIQRNLNKI